MKLGSSLGCLLAMSTLAAAQSVERTLEEAVSGRVEMVSVLSASTGSSAGVFRWNDGSTEMDITKLFGLGTLGKPEPWWGDVKGQVLLGGGIGFFEAIETFNGTPLEGNESSYTGVAMSFEMGARLHFTDRFSLSPTLGLLYGHTRNDFDANTPTGQSVAGTSNGKYVDWVVDSLTLAPSLEAIWVEPLGDFTITLASRAIYYLTEGLSSSSSDPDIHAESLGWVNRIDVDYLLDASLFGFPLHAGGQFLRMDQWGSLEDSLHTSYFYSAGPRIMADVWGHLWKVRYIGLSATYFWSNAFDGWTWALEVRFDF